MIDLALSRDSQLIKGVFLDPSCGNGNILIEVLKRKIQLGIHPLEALENIYGIELMEDNVNRCKERLIECAVGYFECEREDAKIQCVEVVNTSHSGYPRIVNHNSLMWDVEKWLPKNETDDGISFCEEES